MHGTEGRFVPSVRFLGIRVKSFGFKKIVMKNIELLRQCFQISRGQIWGWVSLILSEVIIPSYYCLFFFLTYYYIFFIFHTHLSDIPYEFNCDFLDSHSTMTICSLTWIYTRSLRYTEIGQISQNKHMYFKT